MYKIILTSFLLTFICINSYSQKYEPIVDTSKVWSWTFISGTEWGPIYNVTFEKFTTDTIINNKKYTRLTKFYNDSLMLQSNNRSLLRDDTLGRVYVYSDGTETILFDFNLNVGDTFRTKQLYSDEYLIVDSIADKKFAQKIRKHIYFSHCFYHWNQLWIEGIGCIDQVPGSACIMFDVFLSCYLQNGELLYHNSNCNTCYCKNEPSNINIKKAIEIKVFPNPSSSYINIELENNNESTLELYNQLGIKYNFKLNSNINRISINNYLNGIYFYRIIKENEIIKSGTFIKQ